eukprot:scaffold105855_cov80-Phaeocystis_antarctica.AAC.1
MEAMTNAKANAKREIWYPVRCSTISCNFELCRTERREEWHCSARKGDRARGANAERGVKRGRRSCSPLLSGVA